MLLSKEQRSGLFVLERRLISTPQLHIEIGGAPLLPALSMINNKNTTVVVVDPIVQRLTKPLVTALETDQFCQIPSIIKSIPDYDEVSLQCSPLISMYDIMQQEQFRYLTEITKL